MDSFYKELLGTLGGGARSLSTLSYEAKSRLIRAALFEHVQMVGAFVHRWKYDGNGNALAAYIHSLDTVEPSRVADNATDAAFATVHEGLFASMKAMLEEIGLIGGMEDLNPHLHYMTELIDKHLGREKDFLKAIRAFDNDFEWREFRDE